MQINNFSFYRSIKVENLSKRMSNHSSCILVLTRFIGFHETNGDGKIVLADEVEVDTLAQFTEYLGKFMIKADPVEPFNVIILMNHHMK